MQRTASELAEYLGGRVEGNPEALVKRFAKIEENGGRNSLTFLANMDYEGFIYQTDAEVAIVSSVFCPSQALPETLTLIRVEEPYDAFARLLALADEQQQRPTGIHATASISDQAEIATSVAIGAFVVVEEGAVLEEGVDIRSHAVIGRNARIGANTTVHPFVHVRDGCEIGAHCVLHTGACVGADGFGFAPQEDRSYSKVPQTGNVIIGDYCDIGAGTCIDRATLGSTRIGQGTKLDNLIQIAHNVSIGSHTVIAAQTGVAGSTTIGSFCMIGGQVGIGGHLKIADGTRVAAQSGVSASIKEPNQVVQGTPAVPIKNFQKQHLFLRRMVREEWDKKLSALESKLNASS